MSNYRLQFIEDQKGDLVDVLYWHSYCAGISLDPDAPSLGWPCPDWPDYSVYCRGCGEMIHEWNPDD